MLYAGLRPFILNSSEEYDLLARITQHPERPKPVRAVDQIFMLPGSQLNQVKLISPYTRNRHVAFVGDGDCMALCMGLLAKEGIIDGPEQMLILDFDERLIRFVNRTARQFGFHDRIETLQYNVVDPVPESFRQRYDVFYTNPPYGSKNRGQSGMAFLARGAALCSKSNSSGISILPYGQGTWSQPAMYDIQSFMLEHGYVVGDMLRGMHSYHLDDSPTLRSATVVFDRAEAKPSPYEDQSLPESMANFFYGSENLPIPVRIDGAGEPIYE